jgi:two-component system, NarL family, invasion response regulator UvrY
MQTRQRQRSRPIRVVVVDDHDGVRTAMERVLEGSPEFSAVSALADDRHLFDVLAQEAVDVVVLDHDLGRTDGLSLCLRIKCRHDSPPVVIYSGYAAPLLMLAATVAQADAVVHKAGPVGALLDAVRCLTDGRRLLPAPAPDLVDAAAARLHAADVPVMARLLEGMHPVDVANALALDEAEVGLRARRIVEILQVRRGLRS